MLKFIRSRFFIRISLLNISFFLLISARANAQLTHLSNLEHSLYHLDWSPDGTKLSGTFQINGVYGLGIVDLETQTSELLDTGYTSGDYYNSWSPDGNQIAFAASVPNSPTNIYLYSLDDQSSTLLTSGNMPVWSPDGQKIAFFKGGVIYTISVSGGPITGLTSNAIFAYHPNWSPDGENILYTTAFSGNEDIWIVPSAGGNPTQITFHNSEDDHGSWSPDSKQIVFESKRSGKMDVWIISLENMELTQFSASELRDGDPAWSPDGKKIAFISDRSGEWSIWIKEIGISTGVETEHPQIPKRFKLNDNYPNPFNPSTTITYELYQSGQVELSIYDIRGRLVKNLLSGFQTVGSHSIKWDGKIDSGKMISASGIYYYRIKSGGRIITKKMLLLK